MSDKIEISATIVLYREDLKLLKKTVESFLSIPLEKKLFLIDNSPSNILEKEFNSPEISYFFMNENVGFGKGHNVVLDQIKQESSFHLILNPDVEFDGHIVPKLIEEIRKQVKVAMIAPKVIFPDGKFQYTCRKYPKPLEMIFRRMNVFKKYIQNREYRDRDLGKPFFPDFIHGCFMLFRTKNFVELDGFDERYFLYMEDVDICKKIDEIGMNKLFYPEVQICHYLQKKSAKNLRLFFVHFNSSLKYFKKWGF